MEAGHKVLYGRVFQHKLDLSGAGCLVLGHVPSCSNVLVPHSVTFMYALLFPHYLFPLPLFVSLLLGSTIRREYSGGKSVWFSFSVSPWSSLGIGADVGSGFTV